MTSAYAQYLILGLPYVMAAVFVAGFFFRAMIWYTVRRHEWFAREFERRVNRFIESEHTDSEKSESFYVLSKRMLERTYYEAFSVRDRLKRRKGDPIMSMSDRVFLVKQGCAWLVRDVLKQLRFLRWTPEAPKLLQITKATLHHNPCFSRVFGLIPMTALNDLISLLPGLFVIAGILGTFVGISGGLNELGGMNLQDMETSKNIMDHFLHEIAFAMKTSIAGIVFSLLSHVINVTLNPERAYVSLVDRFENALDLLWYRSGHNDVAPRDISFDEHRDPIEALAEDAVNAEVGRTNREHDFKEPPKSARAS